MVTDAEAPAGMFGNAQSFAIYIEVNPVLRVASGLSSKDITNTLYANGLLIDVQNGSLSYTFIWTYSGWESRPVLKRRWEREAQKH